LIRAVFVDAVDIAVERKDVPPIAKLLVSNDISLYSIFKLENSLEDAFISITGGGNPIA